MKMFQEDRNLPFSVYIAQDEKFSWHCHKHMELDYCSEGHCTIKVNGESYDCQPGDFVIIHTICLLYTSLSAHRFSLPTLKIRLIIITVTQPSRISVTPAALAMPKLFSVMAVR